MDLSAKVIKNCAVKTGFDMCGITTPHKADSIMNVFEKWIDSGSAANMEWVHNNKELRADPGRLLDGCKSIIVLGLSYCKLNYSGNISMLADGIDYHFVMKDMLRKLHHEIEKEYGLEVNCKICVDSAPVFEKYWAEQSGLGWIGRNTLLINSRLGSFFVLGELLIDIEVDEYDSKTNYNGCGNCNRCVDHCPPQALLKHRLDARRCISYLTIEHKGEFNEFQKSILKSSIYYKSYFGCDICQRVCPWNKKAAKHLSEEKSREVSERFKCGNFTFDAEYLRRLTPSRFKKIYRSTSLYRCSFKNILRNIDILI